MTTQLNTGTNVRRVRHARLSAVIMVLLGSLALCLPSFAGLGITLVLGVLTLLAGLTISASTSMRSGTGAAIWRALVAGVYIFSGLYLLLHPKIGLTTLTFVLAVVFCVEGFAELLSYFSIRSQAGSPWLLLNALISLLLGYAIARGWPNNALWALGTLVGINLILNGLTRIFYIRARDRLVNTY